MSVALYCRGAGCGHLVRAVSIARHLKDATILTDNSWLIPTVVENLPVVRKEFVEWLQTNTPDILVVDVFPLGFHDELKDVLPSLSCRKVFVYRHVKPKMWNEGGLRHYDEVILHEPGIDGVDCNPILPRDPLTLPRRQGEVLVVPSFPTTRYPLMEEIALSSAVYGQPGCMTFWEATSLGVPGNWRPVWSMYDDQRWRISQGFEGPLEDRSQRAAAVVLGLNSSIPPDDNGSQGRLSARNETGRD